MPTDNLAADENIRYADMVCTQQQQYYVCAQRVALLKTIGGIVNSPLATQVAALPMKYRGDAEVVLDFAKLRSLWTSDDEIDFTQFDAWFKDGGLGIGALRIGNGAYSLRGWFQVKAKSPISSAIGVPNVLTKSLVDEHPSAVISMRFLPRYFGAKFLRGPFPEPTTT